MLRFFAFAITVFLLFASCGVMKRHYRSGFFVEWSHTKQTKTVKCPEQKTELVIKDLSFVPVSISSADSLRASLTTGELYQKSPQNVCKKDSSFNAGSSSKKVVRTSRAHSKNNQLSATASVSGAGFGETLFFFVIGIFIVPPLFFSILGQDLCDNFSIPLIILIWLLWIASWIAIILFVPWIWLMIVGGLIWNIVYLLIWDKLLDTGLF